MINNDAANQAIDNTDGKAKKTSLTFGEMVASVAKVGAGIAMAMGVALIAVSGLAVSFTEDLQKSLNGVQSATGVADEMMVGMKDTMLAIYNNNFGENFEEIGAAMTLISQQTGLAGEALQGVTENALALKDTFGMEVETSILGANQLMKQFGLTGEESYNLIAQGAQWGLDANGDLLDTLREYSGTFAAQGFSAEQMFNMLQNGAASGVRDVDLLADAIKEFGIRSVDGSKASAEGFTALGLNAANMTASFAAGGDKAKAAFDQTTTALIAMKDPVAQTAAGVALFGTQFEDLGIKGITALVNTQGEISKTVDSLGKINAVKYDTATEAWAGIKRNLETSILIPLGEKIMPKINEFAAWIIENMPMIKNEIEFAFTAAGEAISATSIKIQEAKEFFAEHWKIVAPILAGIAGGAVTFGVITAAVEAWRIVTATATAVQWLFNAALTANPIGIVIVSIGLLTAAGVALYMNFDTVKTKTKELWVSMENTFKSGVNTAVDQINNLIEIMNRIPGVNAPLIARVRLDTSSNSTSDGMKAGRNANGTNNWRGGLTWVGEEGPELIDAPGGSRIFSNGDSMAMAGGYRTANIYLQLDGQTLMRALGEPLRDLIIAKTGLPI